MQRWPHPEIDNGIRVFGEQGHTLTQLVLVHLRRHRKEDMHIGMGVPRAFGGGGRWVGRIEIRDPVQGFGEREGERFFSDARGTGEEVGVGDASGGEDLFQFLFHSVLTHNAIEADPHQASQMASNNSNETVNVAPEKPTNALISFR
jgi:hypothetical protein